MIIIITLLAVLSAVLLVGSITLHLNNRSLKKDIETLLKDQVTVEAMITTRDAETNQLITELQADLETAYSYIKSSKDILDTALLDMRRIDEKGYFESNDYVGFQFKSLLAVIEQIDEVLNDEAGSEEK